MCLLPFHNFDDLCILPNERLNQFNLRTVATGGTLNSKKHTSGTRNLGIGE